MTISYHRLSNSSNKSIRPNRFIGAPPSLRPRRLRRWLALGIAMSLLLTTIFFLLYTPDNSEANNAAPAAAETIRITPKPVPGVQSPPAHLAPLEITQLRTKNAALSARIRALAPAGLYLVIDTASNKVLLRHGEETRAEMVASCGSGNVLEDPVSGRRWIFDTPRGQFRVQSKLTNPIWMKPDWAFIEEGEKIPTKTADRAESGMMGDYALGIGDGYFIHGTLYTRMLGRNVSHGCVRLGDKDLEQIYRTLPIGARVIIF